MRFALRNKAKIAGVMGDSFYKLLLKSLKAHQKDNSKLSFHDEVDGRQSFLAESVKSKGTFFQFVILKQLYDVYVVAYFSTITDNSIKPK